MRRSDRLFQIIQLLRTRRCLTAAQIASNLEVSVRTVYRDIQDLSLSGTPIIAETGKGYTLDKAYSLPPVTFSESELESLILGARMVQAWSDQQLAADATRALQRIESILPKQLRGVFESRDLIVPVFNVLSDTAANLPAIRGAIKSTQKVSIDYKRADGELSQRTIWPLGLFFWGKVWTLVAWCELRGSHRQFRIDRIESVETHEKRFSATGVQTLAFYLSSIDCEKNL